MSSRLEAWLERVWYEGPPSPRAWWEPIALALLTGAEGLFRLGAWARTALYDRGWLPVHRIDGLTVISVGNVAVGGSGKTPVVIHLARLLLAAGVKVGVQSRGYGRLLRSPRLLPAGAPLPSADEIGDEPLLIARACPGVALAVGADRVGLARRARAELGVEVLLLDDGLQHRRLARDVDIVVMGKGAAASRRLLPRGPQREPLEAVGRAQVLWLTEGVAPAAPFPGLLVRSTAEAVGLCGPGGARLSAKSLQGKPVLAFCGIARPERFFRTLADLGADVRGQRRFGDHHRYAPNELDELRTRAQELEATLVTTEKDLARLPPDFPAFAVSLELRLVEGEGPLLRLVAPTSR